MYNRTGMFIANGISLWNDMDFFTCRKHNVNDVIDSMLFFEAIK